MAPTTFKIPGPGHEISIERNPKRIVVAVDGRTIADTVAALTLREADYPPVQYIPREDVDMAALARSETTTICPYKGVACYFHLPAGGTRARDAVWSYETPHPAVAAIAGHLAFYPDRVDGLG